MEISLETNSLDGEGLKERMSEITNSNLGYGLTKSCFLRNAIQTLELTEYMYGKGLGRLIEEDGGGHRLNPSLSLLTLSKLTLIDQRHKSKLKKLRYIALFSDVVPRRVFVCSPWMCLISS